MQNQVSRALRQSLPASWRDSVYGENNQSGEPVAAYAAADPGNQQTDAVEVSRHQGRGWTAQAIGYNERRWMGDVVETAGPFDSYQQAAKAAGDLVRKNFVRGVSRSERMRERNYGRSQNFGQAEGDDLFGGFF